jgi:hypothetical protein
LIDKSDSSDSDNCFEEFMNLNETYSKVCIGKHLSDKFPIQNGVKPGDALSPLIFNFALENCH